MMQYFLFTDEDMMYGSMSEEEKQEEEESEDDLPKIGRQKKADSDSDFKAEEDSGSDWEEAVSLVTNESLPLMCSMINEKMLFIAVAAVL